VTSDNVYERDNWSWQEDLRKSGLKPPLGTS
jgi:hypothetical protein